MSAPATRPRYARIGLFGGACLVTLVTVLGGLGVLPSGGESAYARPGHEAAARSDRGSDGGGAMSLAADRPTPRRPGDGADRPREAVSGSEQSAAHRAADEARALPRDSGAGRRVVFDMSAQRVWLVGAGDRVRRTYLVSGSLTDNLRPGRYSVYSRSARAWGVDDSGSMEFMVRFAHGDRAAIGFHSIPVKDGVPLQSRRQLGTPQSHGCIRQARPDAKAMWDFAPLGTPVVVTA